jgi:hypothetical protein
MKKILILTVFLLSSCAGHYYCVIQNPEHVYGTATVKASNREEAVGMTKYLMAKALVENGAKANVPSNAKISCERGE